jgi:putative membrane protein insertion efficiency factor
MKLALTRSRPHLPASDMSARSQLGPLAPPRMLIARGLIGLVRLYQLLLSPLITLMAGRVCRFEPSCSRYAVACLEAHGAARGSLLSLRRLCKCHPFHPGGHDPPPGTEALVQDSQSSPTRL